MYIPWCLGGEKTQRGSISAAVAYAPLQQLCFILFPFILSHCTVLQAMMLKTDSCLFVILRRI